jgi:hypothetical protein
LPPSQKNNSASAAVCVRKEAKQMNNVSFLAGTHTHKGMKKIYDQGN